MANSRVVNPCMAVFAAVSVACVIGPFVVVRGEVTAENSTYLCNVNPMDFDHVVLVVSLHDVLTDLANLAAKGLHNRRETYYPIDEPTDCCCGPDSCEDSKQNLNTSTGIQIPGYCVHAKCNKGTDCAQCVTVAGKALAAACKLGMGGQIQLRECRIRYEAYCFKE